MGVALSPVVLDLVGFAWCALCAVCVTAFTLMARQSSYLSPVRSEIRSARITTDDAGAIAAAADRWLRSRSRLHQ